MIKIDKNVPLPEKGTMITPKYPYKDMKIGDLFFEENKKSIRPG